MANDPAPLAVSATIACRKDRIGDKDVIMRRSLIALAAARPRSRKYFSR